MSKDALRSNLEKLHRELAAARHLDKGTHEQLAEVAAQIERILAEAESESAAPVDAKSTRDEVEATALRFEAEHPQFAQILSEITDTLAKLGI